MWIRPPGDQASNSKLTMTMYPSSGMVATPQQGTSPITQNGSTTLPRSHHQRTGKHCTYLEQVLLVGKMLQ